MDNNAPGIQPRNYNYSEIVLLLVEQSKQVKEQLLQHAGALHALDESVIRLQQQNALNDQANMQLRQQLTHALLSANEAEMRARGIGESLDKLRSIVELDRSEELSRHRMVGLALVSLIVLILILIFIIGAWYGNR